MFILILTFLHLSFPYKNVAAKCLGRGDVRWYFLSHISYYALLIKSQFFNFPRPILHFVSCCYQIKIASKLVLLFLYIQLTIILVSVYSLKLYRNVSCLNFFETNKFISSFRLYLFNVDRILYIYLRTN